MHSVSSRPDGRSLPVRIRADSGHYGEDYKRVGRWIKACVVLYDWKDSEDDWFDGVQADDDPDDPAVHWQRGNETTELQEVLCGLENAWMLAVWYHYNLQLVRLLQCTNELTII